jgi:hypothetical protein
LKIIELELELGRLAVALRETTEFKFEFHAAWCRPVVAWTLPPKIPQA